MILLHTCHASVLGEFGIVYKGYIKRSDSHSIESLAIKTLKGIIYDIHKYSLYLLLSSMYRPYFDSLI